MPKFYCTHCGQHIDAPDELAGTHAACPSCGGEIDVPKLPIRFESELKHPEPTATKDIEPTKQTRFWSARSTKATIVAGGLCLLATITRASTPLEKMGFSDRGIATSIGETLGRLIGVGMIALIFALIIAGIMAACKKRFSTALSRAYSIGVLIVSVLSLCGNFFSGGNTASNWVSPRESEAENARKMISGIEDDIRSVIKGSAGPDGLPRKNELRFESAKSATDDMQKVREMIQSFFNDMMGLQNEYLQALENDGINTLLDANRIARDKDFKASRLTLLKVKRTVADTRTKASKILADFPQRFKDYKFGAAADNELLEGYKKGLDKALPQFEEIWDLEVEAVAHMESLIDHLELTRLYWSPDQGKFVFERDRDVEQFNQIMAKITKCVDRQTDIRETTMKNALNNIENIKDKIPR